LASAIRVVKRGTMLWFNTAEDRGELRTEDGERTVVAGTAFAADQKPGGRCAGKAVEFEALDGVVSAITFLPQPSQPRARRRRR
jgi:hypothetical protein